MFRVHFRISNFYINSKFWILKYKHLVTKDKGEMFDSEIMFGTGVEPEHKMLSERFLGWVKKLFENVVMKINT